MQLRKNWKSSSKPPFRAFSKTFSKMQLRKNWKLAALIPDARPQTRVDATQKELKDATQNKPLVTLDVDATQKELKGSTRATMGSAVWGSMQLRKNWKTRPRSRSAGSMGRGDAT